MHIHAYTMGSPTDGLGRESDKTQHQVALTQAVFPSSNNGARLAPTS